MPEPPKTMTPSTNNSSYSLIQVVPNLPPVIDGIGDYALQLAKRLRAHCGVETSFIVCDPEWPRDQWGGEFVAIGLAERSQSQLLDAVGLLTRDQKLTNSPILLQFSPYGYQKRGVPAWLVAALETLESRHAGRVNVGFHELDVNSSRVLSSAFWVPPMQRLLVRRLLRIADFVYTNTDPHRAKLQTWGKSDVSLIPNFSNIGELDGVLTCSTRRREIVIFGRADQRRWTYTHGAEALTLLCAHINATDIIDIGAPLSDPPYGEVDGIPIRRRGLLPGEEVALAMRTALAAFMYYPISLLSKSGVHALACASGTISFICTNGPPEVPCAGLVEGLDYILVKGSDSLPPIENLEQLAPAICSSYSKRTSTVAAKMVAERLYGRSSQEMALQSEEQVNRCSSRPRATGATLTLVDPDRQEVIV